MRLPIGRTDEADSSATESRSYVILGAVSLAVLISALDLTVVASILPQVIYDIQLPFTKLNEAAWIVSAYLLAYTATMPMMGRVSDLYGRRLVFVLALALFVVGSYLCARADTLAMLIGARVVQALGGGAMVPVAMAIVGDVFPAGRRAFAIGIVGAVDTAGWVIGPLYGALIAQVLGTWRWVFYINMPIAALTLVLIFIFLRHLQVPRAGHSIDYLGAALLTLALTALSLALSNGGAESGVSSGGTFAQEASPLAQYIGPLLGAAGVFIVLFVVTELRVKSPLVDLSMFKHMTFSSANLTNFLAGSALILAMVNVPIFVQVRGGTALESAEAMAPLTISMAVGALIGGLLSERASYRLTAVIGLILGSGGFIIMSQWSKDITVWSMAGGLVVCGTGFGLVIAPLGTAVINSAREAYRGVASALVIVMRLVGMTIGLSGLTSWSISRLNQLLAAIPALARLANETDSQFQERSLNYYYDQTVIATVSVLKDVFLVAAGICLVAGLVALFLRQARATQIQEPT